MVVLGSDDAGGGGPRGAGRGPFVSFDNFRVTGGGGREGIEFFLVLVVKSVLFLLLAGTG